MEIFTIRSAELHAVTNLCNFIAVKNFHTTNITKLNYRLKHFMVFTVYIGDQKSAPINSVNTLNDK